MIDRSFVFFSPFRLRCSFSFSSRRCSSSLHVDQRRITIRKNSTSVHYPQVTPTSISCSPLLPLPIFFEPKAVRRTPFLLSSLISFFVQVHHYELFPKVIADIVRSNGVQEFHLALTQGLWRYDRWGMPIVGAPPGAELWTWFNDNDERDVNSRWTSFVHELGGLLCASLNFIDSNVSSTSPQYSFRPQSTLPVANRSDLNNDRLRYAVLPREIVCTGPCSTLS